MHLYDTYMYHTHIIMQACRHYFKEGFLSFCQRLWYRSTMNEIDSIINSIDTYILCHVPSQYKYMLSKQRKRISYLIITV